MSWPTFYEEKYDDADDEADDGEAATHDGDGAQDGVQGLLHEKGKWRKLIEPCSFWKKMVSRE